MLEDIHIKTEASIKRRAEQAAEVLGLRNLSAFIRMAIVEKANQVLGKPMNTAPMISARPNKGTTH